MRLLVTGLGAGLLLVFTGTAASATSYGDALGDANTPADVSAVSASESDRAVVVTVDVANFVALPTGSSITLWFDTDANPGTGNADGREALLRYEAPDAIELQLWSGTRLVGRAPTGITTGFSSGRLVVSAPLSTLGIGGAFALLVVSSRAQPAGNGEFVSSDLAPDAGAMSYPGTGVATLHDRVGDHESAPDLGPVEVSDSADGWISFSIGIPNATALPRAPLVGVSIDADDDARTGDSGADLAISTLGTELVVDRWSQRGRSWAPDDAAQARVELAPGIVTIGIQRSELGAAGRFGFAVLAAGVTENTLTGVDVAPDGAAFYRYALQNAPNVRLRAGRVSTTPARPRPGRRVTVSALVTRSDTASPARVGSVTCRVKVDGRRVPAVGDYVGGRAFCAFDAPRAGRRATGSIALRADGISASIPFAIRLR